jgi:small-conductance mechanosensitive channel
MIAPPVASVLNRATDSLGSGLPRVAAAIVLLVVGIVVVRVVARLLMKGLRAAGLDDLAERAGVHDVLASAGLPRSTTQVLGVAVRVALTVVVVFAALSLLGLQFLSESLNAGVLFIPRLLVALVLVVAGIVLGAVARERLERLSGQMDLPVPLAPVGQFVVVAVFGLSALGQIGVSTSVLTALGAILVAAAALAFALAFGLGNRDVARAIGAGRFVRGAFEVGQTISVEGLRGEIEAIEPTGTRLRTVAGTHVHVPNHLLMESVVEVHPPPEG